MQYFFQKKGNNKTFRSKSWIKKKSTDLLNMYIFELFPL